MPEEPSIPGDPVIPDPCETESGGSPGTGLVVNQEELDRWEEHISTGTRPHHGDRCINIGLGSSLSGLTNRPTLVSDATQEPHQLLGTPRSYFAVKAFTKDRRNIHIHLRMDNRTAVSQMGELMPQC